MSLKSIVIAAAKNVAPKLAKPAAEKALGTSLSDATKLSPWTAGGTASNKALAAAQVRSLRTEVVSLDAQIRDLERSYGNRAPWTRELGDFRNPRGAVDPLAYRGQLGRVAADKAALAQLQASRDAKTTELKALLAQLDGR